MFVIAVVISASAVVLSALWLYTSPGFEPAVTCLAGLAGLLGSYVVGRRAKNPFLSRLESSGDLDDLLDRALDELVGITLTDYNQILLSHHGGHRSSLLVVADSIPKHKPYYRKALFDGLIGKVFADPSGRSLNARDVRRLKEFVPAVQETRSELVVPIKSANNVLGVINSESEELRHFTGLIQGKVEQLADALGQLLPIFHWNPRTDENEIPWIRK